MIKIDDYFPFEEIPCTLCKSIVLHNPKFPLTQKEKDEYICEGCIMAVNEKRFW